MASLISKYVKDYVSPKLIFAIDTALSFVASVVTLLLLNFFSPSTFYYSNDIFTYIWLGNSIIASIVVYLVSGCYKVAVRHSTARDYTHLTIATVCKSLATSVVTYLIVGISDHLTGFYIATIADFLLSIFFLLSVRMLMYLVYDIVRDKMKEASDTSNILIYGNGDKSAAMITRLATSQHYRVCGFLVPDTSVTAVHISDFTVYSYRDDQSFQNLVNSHSIKAILFPTDSDVQAVQDTLLPLCNSLNIQTLITPSIDEIGNPSANSRNNIRQVRIEDLLGREEIKINLNEIKTYFKDKVVMVTGAAGSIGSELCRQLASFGVRHLVLFDDAETPTHNLRLELEGKFPDLCFTPMIGDVRHKKRLDGAFRKFRPQVVFHAAAYKHVPLMEENPCEAVMVNVYGSRNVADKCVEYGTEMMVMISTDKAVNPTNIMGCTKRLAEIYVQTLGRKVTTTKFVTTRFGNVLGSNGSVIPRFREQIENGGPVTVTHPDITRFFMTIPEACRLVMEAATLSDGNQIFVFDMGKSVKIVDLAKRMIQLAGLELGRDIQITYTGLRPGEKLYEEVLSNAENTIPTTHDRIRVAKVREYEYETISKVVNELHELADQVDIENVVRLMKATVPEFISKNSPFEKFDN